MYRAKEFIIEGANLDSIDGVMASIKNKHLAEIMARKVAGRAPKGYDSLDYRKTNGEGAEVMADNFIAKLNAFLGGSTVKDLTGLEEDPVMLDIGCGDGSKTSRLAEANNAAIMYCNDIERPAFMDRATGPTHYIYVKSLTEIPADSVDVIYANMSLHHIREIDNMFTEIGRITKAGSVVIIKEHDVVTLDVAKIVLLEHQLYSKFHDGVPLSSAYGGDYFCRYVERSFWDSKFLSVGFAMISHGYGQERPPINRGYFALYKKSGGGRAE